MSQKTNKLREEDPTKLLLARAAGQKGIVLDRYMIQKVASTLVIESMKVEQLVAQLGAFQTYSAKLAELLDEEAVSAIWEEVFSPPTAEKEETENDSPDS